EVMARLRRWARRDRFWELAGRSADEHRKRLKFQPTIDVFEDRFLPNDLFGMLNSLLFGAGLSAALPALMAAPGLEERTAAPLDAAGQSAGSSHPPEWSAGGFPRECARAGAGHRQLKLRRFVLGGPWRGATGRVRPGPRPARGRPGGQCRVSSRPGSGD